MKKLTAVIGADDEAVKNKVMQLRGDGTPARALSLRLWDDTAEDRVTDWLVIAETQDEADAVAERIASAYEGDDMDVTCEITDATHAATTATKPTAKRGKKVKAAEALTNTPTDAPTDAPTNAPTDAPTDAPTE